MSLITATADDWAYVPSHLHAGLKRWVDEGITPGNFLRCVLNNDLRGAVAHGDPESLSALADITKFLIWHCPVHCWGSRENVRNWPGTLEAMRAEAS
jgi:hypothetical protein